MSLKGFALLGLLAACGGPGLHGRYTGPITGRTGMFGATLIVTTHAQREDGCEVSGTLELRSGDDPSGPPVSIAKVCGLTDGEWVELVFNFPSYAGLVWARFKHDDEARSLRGWVDGNVFERSSAFWRWSGTPGGKAGPHVPP